MNIIRKNSGYTLVELIIALLLTSIMLTAGYSFYVKIHNQTITQCDISEMQQNSRATLYEIVKTARMAGYKAGGHVPYEINGDTLYVYYSETQPLDTFMFYLEDYDDCETSQFSYSSESEIPKKLMKKHNHNCAEIFSDCIHSLSYNAINASTLEITLVVQTPKVDEDYTNNDGVRHYTCSEQVNLRNINL